MINGQFVTLYSLNGQTWLSSPEDIPDTMARLESSRISLTDAKEEQEGKGAKDDKAAKSGKSESQASGKSEDKGAAAPKSPHSQYRVKGPKPRPVLRQGGKVVKGSPVDPISGSEVKVKASVDVSVPSVKFSPLEEGPRRGKLVAPIAERHPLKAKALAAQKAKQEAIAQAKALKELKAKVLAANNSKVPSKIPASGKAGSPVATKPKNGAMLKPPAVPKKSPPSKAVPKVALTKKPAKESKLPKKVASKVPAAKKPAP